MFLLVIHKGPHGLCPQLYRQGEDEGPVAVILVVLYHCSHKEGRKVQRSNGEYILVFLFIACV